MALTVAQLAPLDRRECRLYAVGEADGTIVFAYFDVCIGHASVLS